MQLVSANAAITAADDAWSKSRLDNKASADMAYLAKMQAEVSARAATKSEADATGAALAERSAEMRASEKTSDDAKQVAAMSTLTKTRADAKTKSDEMAVAANSVIRDSRFGTKTSDDAASAAEAEKLVNAKAVAMVVADAKAEAEAQTLRLDREHAKSAADAAAAARSISHADFQPQDKYHAKHNSFAGKAAALAAQEPALSGSTAVAAGAGRPWGLSSTGQHKHRADKEAHERAMLAASTLTCTSLSKSVTTAWCVSVCENGLHFCPPNVCQCEKKAGFGGETTWPAARTPGHPPLQAQPRQRLALGQIPVRPWRAP